MGISGIIWFLTKNSFLEITIPVSTDGIHKAKPSFKLMVEAAVDGRDPRQIGRMWPEPFRAVRRGWGCGPKSPSPQMSSKVCPRPGLPVEPKK